MKIYSFTVSGSTYSLHLVSTYTGLNKTDLQNRVLLQGEFNGDGKVDLLVLSVKGASDYENAVIHKQGLGFRGLKK